MLSKPELRKLIRAHNVLSKITIPKGASLDDMVKLVEKAGYKVNHEKKRLDAKVKRGKQITLKQAEEITKPKTKTALQKQKAQEKKEEKAVEQKKKEREIRKTAVAEEKKRQKPKPKTATIETQTEKPKKQEGKVVRIDQIKVGDLISGDRSKSAPTNPNIPIPRQKGVVVRVNKSGSVKIKFGSDGDEFLVYAPFRLIEKRR